MNGIGLLVFVALQGQVAGAAVPTAAERDFGWQVGEDGVLEYIVQVSPAAAQQMQQQRQEKFSNIPPELAGRVGRAAHLVLLQARKGARGPFRLCAPLILHDGAAHDGDRDSYTPEISAILRDGGAFPPLRG